MLPTPLRELRVMKTILTLSALSCPALAAAADAAPAPVDDTPAAGAKVTPGVASDPVGPPGAPIALDLWPGVGTSSLGRGADTRMVSLGLVTWSGQIDGLDASALAGLVEGDVDGLQASGAAAISRGSVDGAQLGGALAMAGGSVDGVIAAGALALVNGDVDGVIGGGFGAISSGHVDGFAGAGFLAVTGSVDGAEAAGFMSVARGDVDGVQASGFLNLAGGDVDGAQLGVVNIARGDVNGLMVGLVNVADDADVALGLVNILKHGRRELELGASESAAGHIIFKSGSQRVHNILVAELRPRPVGGSWSAGLGLGVHTPIVGQRLWADVDLLASHQSPQGGFNATVSELGVARAMVGLQLTDSLSVLGGPTWSALLTDSRGRVAPPPAPVPVFDAQGDRLRLRQWPGAQVAVQLHAPHRGG